MSPLPRRPSRSRSPRHPSRSRLHLCILAGLPSLMVVSTLWLIRVVRPDMSQVYMEMMSNNHTSLSFGSAKVTRKSFGFDYSTPALKTSWTLDDPDLMEPDAGMIVMVMSARGNFARRRAIRETWAQNHAVYFVIGGPPPGGLSDAHQDGLVDEQTQFRDLLDAIHPDSYQSLPYKVQFAYKWTVANLPTADWIVKVDDDTVVRVETLSRVFLRNLNPSIPMVVGRIIVDSQVARQGKWAEHRYRQYKYPYWPQGSCGHVVSRPIADYIGNAENLVYYQGEDTSIGIWLDESELAVSWVHSAYFSNDGRCLQHAWLIMGHEVSEDEMRKCYEHSDEWPIEDQVHKHRRYWSVETLQQQKDIAKLKR